MTRPISRIPAILSIIQEAWVKNPDLRLGQLLENAWVNFFTEDLSTLVENFHKIYWTTPLLWWTFWINWDKPLKYLKLKDMETSHIQAILNTQDLTKEKSDILVSELLKRLVELKFKR